MSFAISKMRKIHHTFDFSDSHLVRFNFTSHPFGQAPSNEQIRLVRERAWNAMSFLDKEGLTTSSAAVNLATWPSDFKLHEISLTDAGFVFVYNFVRDRVCRTGLDRGSLSSIASDETIPLDTLYFQRQLETLHARAYLPGFCDNVFPILDMRLFLNTLYQPRPPQWYSDVALASFQTFMHFAKRKGFLTWDIDPDKIDFEFRLWSADLTPEGAAVFVQFCNKGYGARVNGRFPSGEPAAELAFARNPERFERLIKAAQQDIEERKARAARETADLATFSEAPVATRAPSTRKPRKKIAKHDAVKWHTDGNFPAELEPEAAATPIGQFLTFCLFAGFASEDFVDDFGDDLEILCQRKLTPGELLRRLDGVLLSEHLTAEGNAFVADYYSADVTPNYLDDHSATFPDAATPYAVSDSWANYLKLAPLLTQRLANWTAAAPDPERKPRRSR